MRGRKEHRWLGYVKSGCCFGEQLPSTWGQPLRRESPPPGIHTDRRPTPTLGPGRNQEAAWFPASSPTAEPFQAGGRTAQGRNDVMVGKRWSQMSQSPGTWGPHQPATRQMAAFSFQHLGYKRGIFNSRLWTSSFLFSKMGEITSQGCREDSILKKKKKKLGTVSGPLEKC